MTGSDERRLRWAADLVNTDIMKANLRALRTGLLEFFLESLVGDEITALHSGKPGPSDFSHEDFLHLQQMIKKLLGGLLTGDREGVRVQGNMSVVSPLGSWTDLYLRGPTQDMVLFNIGLLLLKKPHSQIKRCEAKEGSGRCEKLFYRYRGQRFCSRKCTNREMSRRKRKSDREKEATRQRKKYERKVKATHGENVKIQTRKRRK